MTPASPTHSRPLEQIMKIFTPEEDRQLGEIMKGCPASACEAALTFRKTREESLLPVIVRGLVKRYVAQDLQERLALADDDLLLAEHLGLDSLTMTELVMITEDVLQISIENREIRELHTVGDLQRFVRRKLQGATDTKSLPWQTEAVN